MLPLLVFACRSAPYQPRIPGSAEPEKIDVQPAPPAPELEPTVVEEQVVDPAGEVPDIVAPPPPPVVYRKTQDPRPSTHEIDSLVLLAGRPILAGLPAVREAERERERRRALDEIAKALASSSSHHWGARFIGLLTGDIPASEELWCAAVRVVGALGRYELAAYVVSGFDWEAGGQRLIAAQEALHLLYGRWFATAAEVEPFLHGVQPSRGTTLLLAANEVEQEESRAHLFEALRHDTTGAEVWLRDPDPRVRAGVAQIVGESLAKPDAPRDELLEALFQRLAVELEPRAFHAVLQSIAGALQSSPPDSPDLVRLRAALVEITAVPGDGRTLSAAQALALLPWRVEPPGDEAHLLSGLALVGDVLVLQAADGRGRFNADLELGALQALQVLCDRAESNGLSEDLRRNRARIPVFDILQDVRRDETVRAAAVEALGSFALPEDWELLVAVLDDGESTPVLTHALLGALPSILYEFGPRTYAARALLSEVARLSGAEDPDLRRRALALLFDDRLESHVRELDTSFLVDRMDHEQVPDLLHTVLLLLRRFGNPEMLPAVLETKRFDDLATEGPESLAELAETLVVLADGRPLESIAAAERLTRVTAEEARVARTRHSLIIVAALDEESVGKLGPRAHWTICAWSWSLHSSGVALSEATPKGVDFVDRLVRIHLPGSVGGRPVGEVAFDDAEEQHLVAVTLAVLVMENVEGSSPEDAERAFEKALTLAELRTDPSSSIVVRLDRARFRAATDQSVRALADYRALVKVDALEIPDLRTVLQLLAKIGGATPAGRRAIAPESFDLLGRIIGRPSWFSEPASVRVQDLRDLADTAIASADRERMRRYVEALDELPDEPEAQEPTVDPPLWFGLTRKPEWLAELGRQRERVRVAMEEPTAGGSSGGSGR